MPRITIVSYNRDGSEGKTREVKLEWGDLINFYLENEAGECVKCRAFFGSSTVWLGADGYRAMTEADHVGTQVALDVYHHNMPPDSYIPDHEGSIHPSAGHAQVLLWDNVNEEEPRTFSLEGARVENSRQ